MSKKTKPIAKDKQKTESRPPKKGERQLRVEFTEKEILEHAKKLAEAQAKKPDRPPLRTVTNSGVVVTEGDGEGEELQDDDNGKL